MGKTEMKNSRKIFILIESALAVMVLIVAVLMMLEKNGRDSDKVSVIIQDSDDNQWSAFKYGLKMAAADMGIDVFIVSTGELPDMDAEENIIESEIQNGANAVIVQPIPGEKAEYALKKIKNKIPVMLLEEPDTFQGEDFPVVGPDHYAMGAALAKELLKDYNYRLEGKTLGILSENKDFRFVEERREGFLDGLKDTGVHVLWEAGSPFSGEENNLKSQAKVDFVIALDDVSLTAAGACSKDNNFHGAIVYGIGHSTEAVYYLDTGVVECLVVPDEFSVGYECLAKTAEKLKFRFRAMKGKTVSHRAVRRETLFSEENQEMIFTMSQ